MAIVAARSLLSNQNMEAEIQEESKEQTLPTPKELAVATFGTGCFWCTEAVFQDIKGVYTAVSGYSGGHVKNPTYKAVCDGTTGHAECIKITFDPAEVSYAKLLEVFFMVHDPTQLNRQGNDVGTQYRSVIFYHSDEQKNLAMSAKEALEREKAFDKPIVTQIVPAETFYPAEDYHQEYYNNNGNSNPYCTMVVKPKVDKFKKAFKDIIK